MPHTHRLVLAAAALVACRATTSPPPTTTATATPPAATEATTAASGAPVVRGVEAPAMPRCTASDPVAVARLTEGVAATPAISRGRDGGMLAYVTDPRRDGHTQLSLLALDTRGQPANPDGTPRPSTTLLDAGTAPNAPALAPDGGGYLLAWRSGAPGHQRVQVRSVNAMGDPTREIVTLAPDGWLGAPALRVFDGARWVAVARREAEAGFSPEPGSAWATHVDLVAPDGAVRTLDAPQGGGFDADSLVLTKTSRGVQVLATLARRDGAAGVERALVIGPDGTSATPQLIATDLDHPASVPVSDGMLVAWRARVARRDVAARAVHLSADGVPDIAPITLATYRGAFDADVALAPMGAGLVGAFTLSALADDAGGSLNLSLLREDGGEIGRAPILTSFLARSARVAVSSSGDAPEAWLAFDGRDGEDGSPQLVLTQVRCDAQRVVERLDVPPGTFLQDVIDPDTAPVTLSRLGGHAAAMRCTARAHGTFTEHVGAEHDALEGSASGVVVTPAGATLLAVTRAADGGPLRLMAAALDARGVRGPVRTVATDVDEMLAAERVANVPVAVVRNRAGRLQVIAVQGGVAQTLPPTVRDASSVLVVPEGSAMFVVARDAAGRTNLLRVPMAGVRALAPVVIARLRAGDALLDATRDGAATVLLLSRPDPLGREVAQSVARLVVRDGAAARAEASDPFDDPIGHPRRDAQWARVNGHAGLLFTEHATLRVSTLNDAGILRDPHSVVEFFPGGGAVQSAVWGGATRWVLASTGVAPEAHNDGPLTLVALDGATARGVNTGLTDDPSALADGASFDVQGAHVVVLHPRTERERRVTWSWIDATCEVPTAGGSR